MTPSRRDFMNAAGGAAAGAAIASKLPAADATDSPKKRKRPNILFVFGDQWRRHAMGFMKQDPVLTPNIDRFATNARVFTNAISCRPVCSPYRATLFTGRYPLSTGVWTNCNSSKPGVYLRAEETCIGDVLKDAGYATGYIGKWHLDDPTRYDYPLSPDGRRGGKVQWDTFTPPGPRRQGFDFWYSYGCSDHHMSPHYWTDTPEWKQYKEWSPKHETDVAIDFIDRKSKTDDPFCLFLSWNPPHGPVSQVPEKYKKIYADADGRDLLNRPNVKFTGKAKNAAAAVKDYFAAISGLDEQFQRLLECLDETGVAADTIIVLTADHGDMMGSHGRTGKTVYYEESVGIPFLIRWPNGIEPGRDDLLFSNADLTPSLLSMCGLPIPDTVEGKDYSALMRGEAGERPTSALFANYTGDKGDLGYRAIRTASHTFIAERTAEGDKVKWLLFDLDADPYQLTPIYRGQGQDALMKRLAEELRGWLKRTNDPFDIG